MDIQPTAATQPISDDQELAKVLAGINGEAEEASEAPAEPAADAPATDANAAAAPVLPEPAAPIVMPPLPPVAEPEAAAEPELEIPAAPLEMPAMPAAAGELDDVRQEALTELRPLVDKLNVPAEEKFDTYLLLIRSTDDKTLIAPAHEAAKAITDETRRAQALYDIIKEIDFLSGPQQQ